MHLPSRLLIFQVPSDHWKLFSRMPPIAIQMGDSNMQQRAPVPPHDGRTDDAERPITAQSIQDGVIHLDVECKGCGRNPIQGLRFTCYNCDDFSLCHECMMDTRPESTRQTHEASHIFLQIRRPLILPYVDEDQGFDIDRQANTREFCMAYLVLPCHQVSNDLSVQSSSSAPA